MNDRNYKVIVVTNQSGVIRGQYTLRQVHRLHEWVEQQLQHYGARIDDWYVAPHHPEFDPEPCRFPKEDRKPGTGMFLKAARKHHIDFNRSFMAGDKITDLQPAVQLGIKPIFIRSRHEPDQDAGWLNAHSVPRFDTLRESLDTIFIHE
jgi:D-glycero-D-manno-heptose 1,7-bisphosphate phosphatase